MVIDRALYSLLGHSTGKDLIVCRKEGREKFL
jgi:hypothetical protein